MGDITPNRRARRRAQSAKHRKSPNATPAPKPEFAHLAHQLEVIYRPVDELVPQPHTVRAALTGLRKKGYQVTGTKNDSGVTVYRATPPAKAVDDAA